MKRADLCTQHTPSRPLVLLNQSFTGNCQQRRVHCVKFSVRISLQPIRVGHGSLYRILVHMAYGIQLTAFRVAETSCAEKRDCRDV
jgi:hypothetical protein